jgi:hypothetical protein
MKLSINVFPQSLGGKLPIHQILSLPEKCYQVQDDSSMRVQIQEIVPL